MHKAFLGVEPAKIEWREIEKNGTKQFAPYSPEFDDIYFNTLDGIAESEYVFIEGNNLNEKFQSEPNEFSIFETGFGTGLNFLLTANLWQKTNPHGHLSYYSVEQFPIQKADLKKIYQELNLECDLVEPLIDQYPPILPGVFTIRVSNNITLHLIFYPLEKALKEIALNAIQKIDAWFLDGFAPSKNPTMWHKGLWHFMALSAINETNRKTSVATFTAASNVRKMLQHYGFKVSKRKGFGLKREMLTANFDHKQLSSPKPDLVSSYIENCNKPKKVAIVGAGLAGASLAYLLHRHDIEVHLFEQSDSIAAGASKMPALLAMPNLSLDHNSYSQLTFSGLRSIKSFLLQHPHLKDANRAVQLESEKYSKCQLEKYLDIYHHRIDIQSTILAPHSEFALELDAVQVNGPEICSEFVKAIPSKQIHLNTKIESFKLLECFDHIVLSTGFSALLEKLKLPTVMPLRGQVTRTKAKSSLTHPINYDGHLFQQQDNWIIGATFENSSDDSLKPTDDLANIKLANSRLNLQIKAGEILNSYAGIRASSFDRFPYCGKYFKKDEQTVWLNYGYGTRGLCLSLLGAETITASMMGTSLPISKTLLQKLSPHR